MIVFSDKISISLIFDNILDKNYRNYLNRMRFYADDDGKKHYDPNKDKSLNTLCFVI